MLDSPDPRALAELYRSLVGGEITYADDGWVNLRDSGNVLLSFQRTPGYQTPDWPSTEHGQQFHIDVTVDDVDQAEQQILAIGARRTELRPGIGEASSWRVYLDPVGPPLLPLLGLIPNLLETGRRLDRGSWRSKEAEPPCRTLFPSRI